jgi:hypothetical protein
VDPEGDEVRRQVQSRRLPPQPACALCGQRELSVLRKRKIFRHLLEGHHVAGKANDALATVTLCLNCHTKATALQHEVGSLLPGDRPSAIEGLDLALRSLGTFFELLAEACYRWAAQLAQVVVVLDEHLPGWRTLPGMP